MAVRNDGTLTYLLQDRLGSINTAMDGAGVVMGSQKCYLYSRPPEVISDLQTDTMYIMERLVGLGTSLLLRSIFQTDHRIASSICSPSSPPPSTPAGGQPNAGPVRAKRFTPSSPRE